MSKSRVFASAALAGVLVVAGLLAAPAFAEDPPPLVWTTLATNTVDGVTVTWETASSTDSPFGGETLREEMPVLRLEIVNGSVEPKLFGLGTDLVTEGDVGHLWTADPWEAFAEVLYDFRANLWLLLGPNESLSLNGGSAAMWHDAFPAWSGHTLQVFELSEAPTDDVTPAATLISTYVVPGRFVGANLGTDALEDVSELIGTRASVDGGGGSPDLFRGLSATVTASGLTAGEQLDVWIAPNLDYFYFALLGGGLPESAVPVGSDIVAGDRTFSATITLPHDLTLGRYQLVIGDSAERYWPAGSYGDFTVEEAPNQTSASSDEGASEVTLSLEDTALGETTVSISYPDDTTAGETTVIVSPTGPLPVGFTIASDPPLYLHIDTTATLGGPTTVCITYDPLVINGPQPHLYHFDAVLDAWDDITIPSAEGTVCGVTSSFSPIVTGYPDEFDFTGFFSPVSMSGENLAKPGQAIPVKFSLNGDQGLDVVTSAHFVVEGTDTTPEGQLIPATTTDGSGLSYSASSDQYTYVWKTAKTLSLKTGRFELTLSDGTVHTFDVTFKK